MSLLYAIVLLIFFYLLLTAEFFIPSAGVLGIVSAAVLTAAVIAAFFHSFTAGVSMIAFVLITTPLVVLGMLKAWPHTPIGRRMLNRRPGERADAPPPRTTADGTPFDQLIGKVGKAITDLLPGGIVLIGGSKVDVVSIGMPIDAGTAVVVTSVEAGRFQVRAATAEDLAGVDKATQSPGAKLEKSLETLDLE